MRKLIVSMNVTLDGFMSGPQCELDWHFTFWSSEMSEALCCQLSGVDTLLFGRITYQAMAHYWSSKLADSSLEREEIAFAYKMNELAKIVFSNTLTEINWKGTTVIKGDVAQMITPLKCSAGKNIMVYGSGQLVCALMQANLVDELQLWMHPVALSNGMPLFKNDVQLSLKLVDSTVFRSGVVLLCYHIEKNKQPENYNL